MCKAVLFNEQCLGQDIWYVLCRYKWYNRIYLISQFYVLLVDTHLQTNNQSSIVDGLANHQQISDLCSRFAKADDVILEYCQNQFFSISDQNWKDWFCMSSDLIDQ